MRKKKNLQNSGPVTRTKSGHFGIFSAAVYMILLAIFFQSCTKNEITDPTGADLLKAAGIDQITPGDLAESVPVDPLITVAFNIATSESALASKTITLKNGSATITGKTVLSGTTATFTPDNELAPDNDYVVTVSSSSKGSDSDRSKMYSWRFRTGKNHRVVLAVVSATPLANALGVPLTVQPVVTFNKELSSSDRSSVKFSLKAGANTISGNLSFSGNTITFKPSVALTAGVLYTAKVTYGGSGSYNDDDDDDDDDDYVPAKTFSWSFTAAGTSGGGDTSAPLISSVSPANAATAVSQSTIITVAFNEAMNPSTINSTSISVKQGSVVVAGTVTYAGTTATFTPSAALAANSIYTATVSSAAKDLAGNALAANYVWSFTTASIADVTPPSVTSVSPLNGAVSVALNSFITATFSEVMNAATVTSASFTLKQGSTSIAGSVTTTGNTSRFTPGSSLTANTVYTATITQAARDVAGNAIASVYTWSFTTSAAVDATAPTVTSVVPANNATSVATNSTVTVNFSEAMNASTITSASFTLKQGATTIAGTVSYTGTSAKYTPTSSLAAGTVYTASVTQAAKDLAGNAIVSVYNWSFTTAAAVDATAPTVTSVVPANNATSVATNSAVTVNFSEAMNASTITTASFTLKQGTTTVAGTVSYTGTSAKYTPTSSLTAGTVYTASITQAAKDVAGNAIASVYTWSFTTLPAAPAGKSFATNVMPILGLCNDCHNHPWTTSTNASTFYANLVSGNFVNPTSYTSSKIYSKINGGHGSSSVGAANITTIITWMQEGSKNN